MSLNVLVITEDPRYDVYMAAPMIEALLGWIGKPNAVVKVHPKRVQRGVHKMLERPTLLDIVQDNRGNVDLFILCFDRDGELEHETKLDAREEDLLSECRAGSAVIGVLALQEAEVWLLAGCPEFRHRHDWKQIRDERDPKEVYFEPFVRSASINGPGDGREPLGRRAAANYKTVRARCPEDLGRLEARVAKWLEIRDDQHAVRKWIEDEIKVRRKARGDARP